MLKRLNMVNTAQCLRAGLLRQVSAYYISRGHALYFNGNVSSAHADYRRALELDPGNAEARRLCLQFDTKEG